MDPSLGQYAGVSAWVCDGSGADVAPKPKVSRATAAMVATTADRLRFSWWTSRYCDQLATPVKPDNPPSARVADYSFPPLSRRAGS